MTDAKIEHVKIDRLRPDARNANKGTVRGRAMLDRSLRKLGAGRSVVLDKHLTIIGGNKTVEAAADIDLEDVILVHTDGKRLVAVVRDDLDLEQDAAARELAYADNRVAEVGLAWDADAITIDMAAGIDMASLFDGNEITAILSATNKEPYSFLGDEKKEPAAPKGEKPTNYPLAIVLTESEWERWVAFKQRAKVKDDRAAFLRLMDAC